MKRCSRCGETKALDLFVKDKRRRDGRGSWCAVCQNEACKARYARNGDKARDDGRERMTRWRERNPELARQRHTEDSRRFREANPDYHREWYQRNIEKERARSLAVMRHLRKTRPELGKAVRDRYRARHPELIRQRQRENTHRRRALMADASPETAACMTQLLKQPCVYCGAVENITIDHVIPLSRGGKHEPANLAPACVTCNCSKGAKLPEEWLRQSLG